MVVTTQKIISLNIATNTYNEVIEHIVKKSINRESAFIAVANVHMTIEACDNLEFQEMLAKADFATADGVPLVLYNRFFNKAVQERAAGMDLVPDLLKKSSEEGLAILFYGGSQLMLDALQKKIGSSFPDLEAAYYSPPFRNLSEEEEKEISKKINSINPHLVFVALGCPKQEKWMFHNYKKHQSVMIGVGGAIPVYAGVISRAPKWIQDYSLEWLYRLVKEPKRLLKRYLYTNTKFLYIVFIQLIKKLLKFK
jgi:N-acetylglucosaminyldiphosphoundecaprenol N-acetyl-beta-D-mannosaminyltransferase